MKHLLTKNLFLGIVTSVMLGASFCLTNNDRVIISDNIEALSASYEWRPAQNGTWYIPIEMGETPTEAFICAHPTWTYYHAPSGTRAYTGMEFYNLGDNRWDEISHCTDTDGFLPEVILSGEFCYARFPGKPSLMTVGGYTKYGNMYAD